MAPKPFLLLGTGALALAALAAALAPLQPALLLPAAGLALLGWAHLTLCGLLLFYLPAFAKRAVPGDPELPRLLLVLPLVALLALALARPLSVDGPRTFLLLAGFTTLATGLLFGGAAVAGSRMGERAPLHRSGSPYQEGDRAVAAGFLLSMLLLAAGGALLLRDPSPGGAGVRLLLLGALPLLLMAGGYHVFPRAAKRPVAAPALAWSAVLLQAAGAAGLALAAPLGIPEALLPAYGGALLVAALLFGGSTFAAFTRLPPRAGPQPVAARPLGVAAVPFLAAGALLLALPEARPLATPLLAGGWGLLLAALSYLLMPVVLNQVPLDRRLTLALAALAGLAVPLLVLAAAGRAPAWPGLLVAGAAALLHAVNLAPLAQPRRDCPPAPAAQEGAHKPFQ